MARIVRGCSDCDTVPKPPWRVRKEDYLAHLREADLGLKLISGADKLHNARAIVSDLRWQGATVWGRFNAGREDQIWFYRGIVDALRHKNAVESAERVASLGRLRDELERIVGEMERWVEW